MTDSVSDARWQFGPYCLDPSHRRLSRGGPEREIPVALGSRALDLLILLVRRHGQLVTKAEIFEAVWPGVAVEDSNLTVQISTIRKALRDDPAGTRWIETVPGRGYRFVAPITAPARPIRPGAAALGAAETAARRSALAILPLVDLDGDAAQAYFADGMTEELTTALTRAGWFSVLGGATTRAYKGQAIDPRRVGQELGVVYLLTGSIRRADGRVRIACQLVEAETGHQVWAERFDGSLTDIFGLQDRVADAVAGAVEPGLERAEIDRVRARPTADMTAYDLYLRSLPLCFTRTEESCGEAMALLRRSAERDPGFVLAKSQLLACLVMRVEQGWADPGDRAEGIRLARQVLLMCGADPLPLIVVVYAFGILACDTEGALDVARRALKLNPNSALVQGAAGAAAGWAGDGEASRAHFARAIELNASDPDVPYWTAGLARAELMAGRLEPAVPLAERAIGQMPACVAAHRVLIAAHALGGRPHEASAAVQRLRDAAPHAAAFSPGNFRRMYRDGAFAERMIQAWRDAGLPERAEYNQSR